MQRKRYSAVNRAHSLSTNLFRRLAQPQKFPQPVSEVVRRQNGKGMHIGEPLIDIN